MLASSIPAKFNIPFANAAGPSFTRPIPQLSQIGIQGGAASLTDGFPPLTFTPTSSGGIPPWGSDFNGLLNQITAWNRWSSAGGPIKYDSTFAAGMGGYPNGAIVGSNTVPGNSWMSTADNNMTDPDAGGANWVPDPGRMGTGHWQWRPVAAAISGWIISNGTTIGDASSGATQRANADTALLYSYLWSNFSNTQCPVSSGRGANAAADFAAHKTIGTLNMQGIGIMGVDGMGGTPTGLLASVPVQSGSVTLPGSIVGENLHTLLTAELATHNHGITDPSHNHQVNAFIATGVGGAGFSAYTAMSFNSTGQGSSGGQAVSGSFTGITINNNGSSTAHNNVERSMLGYWLHKL